MDGSLFFDGGPRPDGGPRLDGGPRPDGFVDRCLSVDCPGGTTCLSFGCNPSTGICEESFSLEGTPCVECPSGTCSMCDGEGACLDRCGDGVVDSSAGEQCEPTDDTACPGECLTDCTCDAGGGFFEDFETGPPFLAGWTTASPAWTVSSTPIAGSWSARSGVIGHSGSTTLTRSLRFTTSGSLSFAYRVSSESCCDFLAFSIDGVMQGQWSGMVASTYTGSITAGVHLLTWTYRKDGSIVVGSDAAWIDDVSAPTALP